VAEAAPRVFGMRTTDATEGDATPAGAGGKLHQKLLVARWYVGFGKENLSYKISHLTFDFDAGQGRNDVCAETGSAVFVRPSELRQAEWTEFSLAVVARLSRTSISSTCWCQEAPEVSAPLLAADVRPLP
jgi:hypothetical protein